MSSAQWKQVNLNPHFYTPVPNGVFKSKVCLGIKRVIFSVLPSSTTTLVHMVSERRGRGRGNEKLSVLSVCRLYRVGRFLSLLGCRVHNWGNSAFECSVKRVTIALAGKQYAPDSDGRCSCQWRLWLDGLLSLTFGPHHALCGYNFTFQVQSGLINEKENPLYSGCKQVMMVFMCEDKPSNLAVSL